MNYPGPIVKMEYNKAIETHETLVTFHLAPCNSPIMPSKMMLSEVRQEQLSDLYEGRQIYFLKHDAKDIALYHQTAFSNPSVSEVPRKNRPMLFSLKTQTILSYKLHLVRNFNELKEICDVLIECSLLMPAPAQSVLEYLYNIRNSPSELKDLAEETYSKVFNK